MDVGDLEFEVLLFMFSFGDEALYVEFSSYGLDIL